MKKIFLFLMLLTQITQVNAGQINRIVFFGDSLSDNGNLYSKLLHYLPKSPPYFDGRFTNGPVWAENFARSYLKGTPEYSIYAYGGATAIFHVPTTKFVAPTILELEVDSYLLDDLFHKKDDVLFAIWIGGNDYLFDTDGSITADTMTTNVTNKIAWAIQILYRYGGRHFLILNLPDLGKIPKAKIDGTDQILHAFSVMHNEKLAAVVQVLQQTLSDAKIHSVNIFGILDEAIKNPHKFNDKYHVNVVNLNEACWQGGLWINKNAKRYIQSAKDIPARISPEVMSEFITSNPDLLETFRVGQAYNAGEVPCTNPEEYFFWDTMHPSAVVHDVLARIIVEQLAHEA